MPRFTPIKPVLAIAPVTNGAGKVVDAIIAAAPPPVPTLEQVRQREADRYAIFAQHFGNGKTVKVPEGMMAVTISLKFDNSDRQSDYFDSHASLSQDFAVLIVKKQAQKESLARKALSMCPDVQHLEWEWHKEKYSMGHGNYLESSGFELPPELRGLRTHYQGAGVGPGVEFAHWEIEFARSYNDDTELDAYRTFGWNDKPAKSQDRPQSSGWTGSITLVENDARQGIELHFPGGKPSDDVIAEIHAANEPYRIWKFHFARRFWYARNTPETKAWAVAFIARHAGAKVPEPAPAPMPEPVAPIAPPQNIVKVDFEVPAAKEIPVQHPAPAPVTPFVPAWRRRTTI